METRKYRIPQPKTETEREESREYKVQSRSRNEKNTSKYSTFVAVVISYATLQGKLLAKCQH